MLRREGVSGCLILELVSSEHERRMAFFWDAKEGCVSHLQAPYTCLQGDHETVSLLESKGFSHNQSSKPSQYVAIKA